MNKHEKTLEYHKILLQLAGECGSALAAELAEELIPQPKLLEAQKLLKQTEDAHILTARFGAPSFSGLCNVENALARGAAGGILSLKELLNIGGVLRSIRMLCEWRSRSAGVKTTLDHWFSSLYPNKYFEEKISSSIVSEEEISDNASPELFAIRRKIAAASSKVREQLDKFTRSGTYQKYLQESIVTIRSGRYVVPVKSEYRGSVPGLVHDTSSSGATVFIEPMGVVEANNELKVLHSKEEAEIERILFALSAEAGEFSESILNSLRVAVRLDLCFAKARLAYKMKATVPELNDVGVIDLRAARHPLLDPKAVVPTDVRLGSDFDTLVITGPNTGGKTVTLKTLGLLSLMAMSGLMVPAGERSKLSVFDRILADIGDEQSIEQSLSTFSSHMKNIIDILAESDRHTLILLDELGAGTDPVEGAALANAILEALREKGAKIAATTHYAELKEYALDTDGVENACCEFNVETLSPTYRLLIGVPGRSNAFAISVKLGMDKTIVEKAEGYIGAESRRFERVVADLETSRTQLESQKTEYERLKLEAETQAETIRTEKADFEKIRAKAVESAEAQARIIADNARSEVNRILDELDKIKKESASDAQAKARAAVNAGFKKLDKIAVSDQPKEAGLSAGDIKIGDDVVLCDIGKNAVVLTTPDEQGNLFVQAGIIKTKVNIQNLARGTGKKEKKTERRSVRPESRVTRSAQTELDLRGQNVEEGILELDRFIDNCLLSGMEQLTIIHGKGTGVLRTGIQSHLKRHKSVRSYRLGVFGEGEAGVTIVELK